MCNEMHNYIVGFGQSLYHCLFPHLNEIANIKILIYNEGCCPNRKISNCVVSCCHQQTISNLAG